MAAPGRSRRGHGPINTRSRRRRGGHDAEAHLVERFETNTHAIKVSFVGAWPSLFCLDALKHGKTATQLYLCFGSGSVLFCWLHYFDFIAHGPYTYTYLESLQNDPCERRRLLSNTMLIKQNSPLTGQSVDYFSLIKIRSLTFEIAKIHLPSSLLSWATPQTGQSVDYFA